jgi:tRNA (adenine57-N1/adenine58-N1)-methyltransferase
MSFIHSKPKIEHGDLVFLYSGIKNIQPLLVQRGQMSQVKFGAVRHDELIGRPFGSRYDCAKGSVVVVSPSPELWSLSLPHRTQILYTTDISLICSMLYLKPGSKVCALKCIVFEGFIMF